ncbi:SRPBCC domain-containing protein [Adhaeribacter swui]|uniref:SRPBCC domain-containing protein n=1 Tax=Adhaeribacter swui TaxID=2086471 RepID=A0A7G7G668_9BACT|nr:SRPBCC domain-containing protein [Adhaeribacter swui]QNF32652.1 SRPBCC domain-containing protein [Adhaeribacter swui]
MNQQPLVFERHFRVPPAKVWRAITDKDEMKNWYFDLEEFTPEVGFTFTFTGGPSPEKQYLHLCEVTEVVPESKLTYSWRYEGYAGNSFVTFELFPEENGTLLRLTHAGLESFPKENPDLAAHNFVEGWNSIVHDSLRTYLEPEAQLNAK